jgi:hypothetical protein
MAKAKSLYTTVHEIEGLKDSWEKIFANGLNSSSKHTKQSVKDFKAREHSNLYAIRRELRKRTFAFSGISGIGAKKPGKKGAPRPIVLSPPPVRIVQRRLLDVLQSKPAIKKFLEVKSSFGAIEKKGVPLAIEAVVSAINGGAAYYIKSDIASFFTKVSRPQVLNMIAGCFPGEKEFINLLDSATNLEVENLAALEKKYGASFKDQFIFNDVGTPQGCCLSPLFGNILLYDFDEQMNHGDIVCLRYLDDFIILGPTLKAVNAAFARAINILKPLGLTAYDPATQKNKAGRDAIANGFEFLGVEFHGKNIRPAQKARQKLLDGIQILISESMKVDFAGVQNGAQEDRSMISTLHEIHNKIKGWGNQYYFCNEPAIWGSLDAEIDAMIRKYLDATYARMRSMERIQKRRQLGVHLLIDSKSNPIKWN